MESGFWKEKWAKSEIGFHEGKPNAFIKDEFHRMGLDKGQTVFVPLCGKSMDVFWLLSEGYKVVGVELVESAVVDLFKSLGIAPQVTIIDQFKKYTGEHIEIYVGDFFALTSKHIGKVDAVYDRAALVAMPESMRADYANQLSRITHQAYQFLITFVYDQAQVEGPPFSVPKKMISHLYGDTYTIKSIDIKKVPGGLRGCGAQECLWILR